MAAPETQIRPPYFCGIITADDFIDPDPDIAGIGVILSFIIIGTAVMCLIAIKLYVDWWEHLAFRDFFYPEADELTKGGKRPNMEDARRFIRREADDDKLDKHTPGRLGNAALNSTLFGLADTQFASGIAICVAAFAKEDITGYHYLICDEMAWLALISSTGGLLVARTVLDRANMAKKVLRVALMWCLFGFAAAIELRRNDEVRYAEQVFAAGPYRDLSSDNARMTAVLFVGTVVSTVIDTIALVPEWGVLLYYYVETFVVVSSPPFDTTAVSFITRRCHRCRERVGVFSAAAHFAIHTARLVFTIAVWLPSWIFILALYWLFFQPITTHIANCVFFFWGVGSTFIWRGQGRRCMKPDDSNAEDKYGFGQVVALTLLISPIVANADAWYDVAKAWLKARSNRRVPTLELDGRPSVSQASGSQTALIATAGPVPEHQEDDGRAPEPEDVTQEVPVAVIYPVPESQENRD